MAPRRTLCRVIVLAATLATAAMGAAPAHAAELLATGGKVHGYTLSIVDGTTFEFGQATGGDEAIRLSRTVGGQTLTRSLRSATTRLTASKRLGAAHLTMNLGSHGRVDMRFHPTGRLRKVGEDNCSDFTPKRARRGVLRGVLRARMGGVFGVVRRKRLTATLTLTTAGDCSDPTPMGGDHELRIDDPLFGVSFYDLFRPTGVVDLTAPARRGRHWSLQDTIHVSALHALTVDLPTATARADVTGPFLSSSLSYAASDPAAAPLPEILDPPFEVPGTVTGVLTARFDRIGGNRLALPVPHAATLHGECEQCF